MKTYDGSGCAWNQRGNETGHCSQCHRTFDSTEAFDWHQTVGERGMICRDPATILKKDGSPKYESRQDDLTTYWKRYR